MSRSVILVALMVLLIGIAAAQTPPHSPLASPSIAPTSSPMYSPSISPIPSVGSYSPTPTGAPTPTPTPATPSPSPSPASKAKASPSPSPISLPPYQAPSPVKNADASIGGFDAASVVVMAICGVAAILFV